jgi:hypothetical protein
MKFNCWLWPNRAIGKRLSGIYREEHNQVVNALALCEEALKLFVAQYEGGEDREQRPEMIAARAALKACGVKP